MTRTQEQIDRLDQLILVQATVSGRIGINIGLSLRRARNTANRDEYYLRKRNYPAAIAIGIRTGLWRQNPDNAPRR